MSRTTLRMLRRQAYLACYEIFANHGAEFKLVKKWQPYLEANMTDAVMELIREHGQKRVYSAIQSSLDLGLFLSVERAEARFGGLRDLLWPAVAPALPIPQPRLPAAFHGQNPGVNERLQEEYALVHPSRHQNVRATATRLEVFKANQKALKHQQTPPGKPFSESLENSFVEEVTADLQSAFTSQHAQDNGPCMPVVFGTSLSVPQTEQTAAYSLPTAPTVFKRPMKALPKKETRSAPMPEHIQAMLATMPPIEGPPRRVLRPTAIEMCDAVSPRRHQHQDSMNEQHSGPTPHSYYDLMGDHNIKYQGPKAKSQDRRDNVAQETEKDIVQEILTSIEEMQVDVTPSISWGLG